MYVLSILMLIICCYTDIKKREIKKSILIAFFVSSAGIMLSAYLWGERVGVLSDLLIYELRAENIVFAVIPGVILYFISILTGEAIGRGDVYVICILGLMVGCERIFAMLFLSMAICAVFGLSVMILKGKGRKETLPYMPFLFIAYCVLSVIKISGVG